MCENSEVSFRLFMIMFWMGHVSLWFHFKRRYDEINGIPSWAVFISRNCLLYTYQELKDFSRIIKAHYGNSYLRLVNPF